MRLERQGPAPLQDDRIIHAIQCMWTDNRRHVATAELCVDADGNDRLVISVIRSQYALVASAEFTAMLKELDNEGASLKEQTERIVAAFVDDPSLLDEVEVYRS